MRAIRKRNRRMMAFNLRLTTEEEEKLKETGKGTSKLNIPRTVDERLENELNLREYF